jgi:hypothetical protein
MDKEDEEIINGYCSQCGKECSSIIIDEGIGYYEMGDGRYNHVKLVHASDCCEGEILNFDPNEEEEE